MQQLFIISRTSGTTLFKYQPPGHDEEAFCTLGDTTSELRGSQAFTFSPTRTTSVQSVGLTPYVCWSLYLNMQPDEDSSDDVCITTAKELIIIHVTSFNLLVVGVFPLPLAHLTLGVQPSCTKDAYIEHATGLLRILGGTFVASFRVSLTASSTEFRSRYQRFAGVLLELVEEWFGLYVLKWLALQLSEQSPMDEERGASLEAIYLRRVTTIIDAQQRDSGEWYRRSLNQNQGSISTGVVTLANSIFTPARRSTIGSRRKSSITRKTIVEEPTSLEYLPLACYGPDGTAENVMEVWKTNPFYHWVSDLITILDPMLWHSPAASPGRRHAKAVVQYAKQSFTIMVYEGNQPNNVLVLLRHHQSRDEYHLPPWFIQVLYQLEGLLSDPSLKKRC
ncbi:hypothetical protein GMRT_14201 [Giardia muris]|uniref:Uncharacterized protein n=1 Tax=Giardia muris TaxID=5742 RepID=A0A4Z1SXK8_GIAMU|nr:hypothetical protein GMRT_14201 [Giardia muris]|eukprot:TNJ30260.1 hypothetical protein GMRT_14201 [Giardia muris]